MAILHTFIIQNVPLYLGLLKYVFHLNKWQIWVYEYWTLCPEDLQLIHNFANIAYNSPPRHTCITFNGSEEKINSRRTPKNKWKSSWQRKRVFRFVFSILTLNNSAGSLDDPEKRQKKSENANIWLKSFPDRKFKLLLVRYGCKFRKIFWTILNILRSPNFQFDFIWVVIRAAWRHVEIV